ncbi:MAG: PPC domain-containing protein [Planctomycetaceae bacterium]|nr:PPC domain-containing protein [Planctomycetaceae bacterium]
MRVSSAARILFCLSANFLLCLPAMAASPRLSSITPRGIQRGAEHTIQFNGSSLEDIEEILFYEPAGFTVSKIEPNGNNPKVTLSVAPDCRLGEYVAQVRTKTGLSDYRTFYVEGLPAVAEAEPNSEYGNPQPIPLNVVVGGNISNEDVDYFVVDAKQGERISVEVVAMRLGTALFDPYVAILDSKRFELSANDDTALALQDAYASVIAPEDGKYIIEVRDSSYGAGSNYRLHVGTFPRPAIVYPAGGKLGEETDVQFLGLPGGQLATRIQLPSVPEADFSVFATDAGGVSPTGNPFRLFEHGNAFEQEPNDQFSQATPMQLPLAFNGVIDRPGDVDFLKFTAQKGQVYEIECFARRIRSGLDPVMTLHNASGGALVGNDDSRGPDSYFRFSFPEDGEYVLQIADHLGGGSPDFVYRIEFHPVRPALTLSIPRVEQYGQYRQQIYVPRGGRFGAIFNFTRTDFGGELILDGHDLPAGINMVCENLPANQTQLPVVFEVAADAPLSGKLVDLTARHIDPNQNIRGGFRNRADFIIGPPGQSLYRWRDVDRVAVAVVDEIPFSIEIVEPKAPLVRDGAMQLKIVAHKKEGWDEQINVQLPFRPPGVGATSSVNIPKGQNEAYYPMNANGGVEIKTWRIFALGTSGGMWGASQLAKLEINDPFARFEVQRGSCEQGQSTQILCKINHLHPFEGTATATLLGLPHMVTAEPVQFTKETAELVFNVKTAKESPVGKHNVYCQLVVPHNGESVVSTAGGTQLQIDAPLSVPVAQVQPTPMPQAATPQPAPMPTAAPPKPLSPLEKLRLAAKQRQDKEQSGGVQ